MAFMLLALLFSFRNASIQAEDARLLQPKTNALDLVVQGVDLVLFAQDKTAISISTPPEKDVFFTEHEGVLRVRTRTENAEGTRRVIRIGIPRAQTLAWVKIVATGAHTTVRGVRAVWSLLLCNEGTLALTESTLKSCTLTHTRGELRFEAAVLKRASFCLNDVNARFTLLGSRADYRLICSPGERAWKIEGAEQRGAHYTEPARARRHMVISASASSIDVMFKAPPTQQEAVDTTQKG